MAGGPIVSRVAPLDRLGPPTRYRAPVTDDRHPGAAPPLDAPLPIRLRGPLHVYSAAGLRPAARALVLLAAPDADPRGAGLALDAIARAHADAVGDLFPAPVARGRHEGREFLALDADAAFDGERLLQRLADDGVRLPYPAALGGLLRLADALARVHSLDPPRAVGALLPCQFVYAADGRPTVLGLGDNVLARSAPAGALVAPEVQLGQAPDRRSDGFALAALMRSMVAFTALPPVIERALRGAELATERDIGGLVRQFQVRMWSAPPRLRPDARRLAAAVRLLARGLGVEPDAAAHERFVATVMAADIAAAPAPGTLRVADDAAWFELDGGPRRHLASRGSLRRLLLALLEAYLGGAGGVLAPAALLAAGWPGERVHPDAGTHRVHVAVAELRKMGLRGALERFDAGYRLAPGLIVRRGAI
jgi:hypothetical protein